MDEKRTREDYIATAPIGSIVAFITDDGKYKSAKIINRSTARRYLKLQTAYGREYKVPYTSVIWVKTGSKWPRGIYNLLKGIGEGNGTYGEGGSAVGSAELREGNLHAAGDGEGGGEAGQGFQG